MGRALIDISGQRFGRWLVLNRSTKGADRDYKWTCKCDCGSVRDVKGGHLRGGQSLSCGCRPADLLLSQWQLRPYEALYRVLLRRADDDGITCMLSYDEFLAFTAQAACHYCGSEITWAAANTAVNGTGYNLDRIDNSIGYSAANCVVCCRRCNWAKGDHFTYAEWKQIGELIRGWKK